MPTFIFGDGHILHRPIMGPSTRFILLVVLASVLPVVSGAQSISAKGTCSIRCADGSMEAWGNNGSGELGTGDYFGWNVPVGVNIPSTVASIAPGGLSHSAVIMGTGTLWTWGSNIHGQLGNGTNADNPVPAQVLTDVVAAATGAFHTLAVRSDGTVWASGVNVEGTLGTGTVAPSNTFVRSDITNVVGVAAGMESSVALKSDGTVWAWGLNNYGQLGNGVGSSSALPLQVPVSDVVAIASGRHHVLMLRNDGTVWSFGADLYGALGQGAVGITGTPAPVEGLSEVMKISAGEFHSMAVRADGTLWAWGRNAQGQLGIGNDEDVSAPVQVSALPNVLEASSGVYLSIALSVDGTIWTWGEGASGGLGNGSNMSSNVPVQVSAACSVFANMTEADAIPDHVLGPNPTDGRVTLHTSSAGPLQADLDDIRGRRLFSTTLIGDRPTMDLSSYGAGVYLLTLHSRHGVRTHRLVKE